MEIVPHLPAVAVALGGRSRQEGAGRILFPHCPMQGFDHWRVALGAEFVAATPEDDASVVAQIADDGPCFLVDQGQIIRRAWKAGQEGASQGKFLPDQNAQAVAQIVKGLLLAEATSPDPEQVHVGLAGQRQQGEIVGLGDAAGKDVGRHPVGATGIDPVAVDAQGPAVEFDLAQANGLGQGIQTLIAIPYLNTQAVEVRTPVIPGPPQAGPGQR